MTIHSRESPDSLHFPLAVGDTHFVASARVVGNPDQEVAAFDYGNRNHLWLRKSLSLSGKIIEVRLQKSDDLAMAWSRITAVVEALLRNQNSGAKRFCSTTSFDPSE